MATMNIGSLVVDLIAESAQYIRGLQETNRQTRNWSQDVSRSFNSTAKSIAGMAAGFLSVSAAVSAANSAMANAKEIENMARIANQSVEDFQAATYAVEQYGISAEKLGDISKDVSDKLGDFIATEGGEFADFFENVAPKVNLTAQELQGLAGPDVLIAVKKAMDDANLSMEEQIFYLESIANDTTLLIPLLEDNGKAYRDLAQEARDANLIMSQADISALRESEKVISRVSKQLSTSFARAVAGSAEQIEWLGDFIASTMQDVGFYLDSFSEKPINLGNIKTAIDETREELDELAANMVKYQYQMDRNVDLSVVVKKTEEDIARLKKLEQELMISYSKTYTQTYKKTQLPDQPALTIEPVTSSVIIIPEVDQAAADKAANDIIKANQRTLDNLTRQLATEQELINLNYQKQVDQINSLVLTEEQIKKSGYDNQIQLQSDFLLQAEAARLESLEKLKVETEAATAEAASQFDKLAEAIGANTAAIENAATGWANSFSTELANMVTTGELDFSRLATSIINDLIRIAIQAQITQPLLNAMGMGGTAPAGGGTAPAPAPETATGGPVMKGSTYLVGEQGPELFTASNSGSVVPNNQLGGGGSVVNIYTQPGETAETQTQQTENGDIIEVFMKQVDSRMNEQISRGQGLARTLEGRYSLSRKSY